MDSEYCQHHTVTVVHEHNSVLIVLETFLKKHLLVIKY